MAFYRRKVVNKVQVILNGNSVYITALVKLGLPFGESLLLPLGAAKRLLIPFSILLIKYFQMKRCKFSKFIFEYISEAFDPWESACMVRGVWAWLAIFESQNSHSIHLPLKCFLLLSSNDIISSLCLVFYDAPLTLFRCTKSKLYDLWVVIS